MRKFITERVETLSEEQLLVVKKMLDDISPSSEKEYDLLPEVENILSEREEVLKKLAQ